MFQFLKPAFDVFKKVLLVVIVYFAVISLFSRFIAKDKVSLPSNRKDPILENRTEIYKTINDKELNKTTQGKLTIVVYRGMMCSMMGEACTNNPADADKNYSKSFLGFVSNLIVLPFVNPPASGIAWTYSGLADAGFFPKALAAEGIGMGSIQPFAKIWKIFRDVTYLLLVVVLIAIGFMIMFRTKINPQTVISVENSLPKIIIALILITFSFAIAGFLVDLMYMLIAIIVSILGPVYNFCDPILHPIKCFGSSLTAPKNTADLQKYYLQASPWALYTGTANVNDNSFLTFILFLPNAILDLIPTLGAAVKVIGGLVLSYMLLPVIKSIALVIVSGGGTVSNFLKAITIYAAPAGGGLTGSFDYIVQGLTTPVMWIISILCVILLMVAGVPLVLGLVIWLSLVFVFFRILFMLISSYIKILLSIILSPLYLLFEAIPGQSAFVNWLKGLVGELITFPLVVGIFVLGSIIADTASTGNLVQFPFMVGIDSKSFGYIIGMAILFMTPDLVKAVRAVFIPKPGILDQAGPGVFFGGATTGISGGLGELSKVAGIGFYIKPIQTLLGKLPFGKDLFAQHDTPHPTR